MKRTILKIAAFSLLAAVMAVAPTRTPAQEKKENPAAEKKASPKGDRPLPFQGKITALDKSAKTLTVGKRVFHITSGTKITKDGKAGTLDDASAGEQVGGSYTKSDDGKLTARSLRIGPKPEGQVKGAGKKKKTVE